VLTCLLFVSPWLVGAAVFFLYPLFYSLRLSFGVIENPATQKVVFAGFENFRVAFMEDARFFPMLLSIAKDTLINTPLIVVFALFIATLLSKDIRGKGLFRSVFFLPVILGTGFVMQQLLGVQMNADAVEVARGILLPEKVVRFLNPGVTQVILEFLSRVTLVLWKSGVQIIIFLAGLQAIPRSFYEAARVDAATEWECFWFISLPMMAPTLLLGAVYTIVAGFLDTSNEMLGYIHELGFQWSQFEYASAVSWLYFLFVILVLAALFLLLNPATKRVREG
jgi:ABC transporter, permease protein